MPKKKPKQRKLYKVDLANKNETAPVPADEPKEQPVSDTNGDAQ